MTNGTKIQKQTKPPLNIAFAVGGLGGNNAHGAGFLHAALDAESQDETLKPEMISCTTGQIYWVHKYLEIRNAKKAGTSFKTMREELQSEMKKVEPFPYRDMNLMTLGLFGKEDAIRLSRHEWLIDIMKNVMRSFERVVKDRENVSFIREFMSTIPARMLVMQFPDSLFSDIADAFNESDIGLAFNSFDPVDGTEFVYLNDEARAHMDIEFGGSRSSGLRQRTRYEPINEQSVRNGLWLYQYGFEDNTKLDGAYYRQVMLDELMPARNVFVARPVSQKWLGNFPTSWIELEDMKTEMSFNGSYQGERDKIFLVNNMLKKLVADGLNEEGQPYQDYHHVTLHEIEMETQERFFDYVFEDMDVFDRAYEKAKKGFEEYMNLRMAA